MDPEDIDDPDREDLAELPYKDVKAVLLTGDASTPAME
jgi:hypothetical protein